MTYVFLADGPERRTVWSPVSRAGALYVGMINVVADVYAAPTGMTARADDLHVIDPDRFEAFVRHVLSAYTSTTHGEILALLDGVLPPSTVLLERCGRPLAPRNDGERAVVERGRALNMVW
ncbi:hypothetical protein Q0Z83_058360 [Actinoplanes sichuanensis]|uniref:DUF6086 family protein n=1 Tax=Actinoplanes sichuanensis TaxID=512349 RepID=A0ABW4APP2_9ACTN|nr:DUF6086 family protein [Actinoplanes sichuanensis]BEL07645.1 hypothetical protein Q0Z83_058360 [Actinoplanes sichuanensis]